MKYVALILKSARRSKRRTILTIVSVALAVFLFASLRAVLDGFNAAADASSSTRIITLRSTSMIFNMPTSHADTIRSVAGVRDLAWANWFGGIYKDPNNFFANIAIDAESYLRLYPEIRLPDDQRRAFLEDRTGCILGEGLAKRFKFKVGDTFVLKPGIPYYGTQDYNFTVRGIYTSDGAFVSMFGNLNLLLGSIALAVVITTLFVAGNTMAMSVRERTTELAVMRTLGFPSGTIFGLVAGEGVLMSVVGGAIGVVLARLVINPNILSGGGFIPALSMSGPNTIIAFGLSGGIGIVAGLIPATMASRLKIVDALRKVA